MILSETVGILFTGHIDKVLLDNTEAKTSLDGCEGVELGSTVFSKNPEHHWVALTPFVTSTITIPTHGCYLHNYNSNPLLKLRACSKLEVVFLNFFFLFKFWKLFKIYFELLLNITRFFFLLRITCFLKFLSLSTKFR